MPIADEFSSQTDQENFFTTLGSGSPSTVPEESTSEDDAEFETKDAAAVTLYKVTDANGQLQVETISTKPIRQEFLKTEVPFPQALSVENCNLLIFDFPSNVTHSGLLYFGHWFSSVCLGW